MFGQRFTGAGRSRNGRDGPVAIKGERLQLRPAHPSQQREEKQPGEAVYSVSTVPQRSDTHGGKFDGAEGGPIVTTDAERSASVDVTGENPSTRQETDRGTKVNRTIHDTDKGRSETISDVTTNKQGTLAMENRRHRGDTETRQERTATATTTEATTNTSLSTTKQRQTSDGSTAETAIPLGDGQRHIDLVNKYDSNSRNQQGSSNVEIYIDNDNDGDDGTGNDRQPASKNGSEEDIGQTVSQLIARSPDSAQQEAVWHGQSLEYAAGFALRSNLLEPSLREMTGISVSQIGQISRFLGEYTRGNRLYLNAANEIRQCSIRRVTQNDVATLDMWWEGDKYLSYTSKDWSDWWIDRCHLFDPGCEMVKMVNESNETLGVAYFERNVVDCNAHPAQDSSRTPNGTSNSSTSSKNKERMTLIRGIRLEPSLNPETLRRSGINGKTRSNDVKYRGIATMLLCHILVTSIRYGTHGVGVNCPKNEVAERFYESFMGPSRAFDKGTGRRYYHMDADKRWKVLQKAFRRQLHLWMKEANVKVQQTQPVEEKVLDVVMSRPGKDSGSEEKTDADNVVIIEHDKEPTLVDTEEEEEPDRSQWDEKVTEDAFMHERTTTDETPAAEPPKKDPPSSSDLLAEESDILRLQDSKADSPPKDEAPTPFVEAKADPPSIEPEEVSERIKEEDPPAVETKDMQDTKAEEDPPADEVGEGLESKMEEDLPAVEAEEIKGANKEEDPPSKSSRIEASEQDGDTKTLPDASVDETAKEEQQQEPAIERNEDEQGDKENEKETIPVDSEGKETDNDGEGGPIVGGDTQQSDDKENDNKDNDKMDVDGASKDKPGDTSEKDAMNVDSGKDNSKDTNEQDETKAEALDADPEAADNTKPSSSGGEAPVVDSESSAKKVSPTTQPNRKRSLDDATRAPLDPTPPEAPASTEPTNDNDVADNHEPPTKKQHIVEEETSAPSDPTASTEPSGERSSATEVDEGTTQNEKTADDSTETELMDTEPEPESQAVTAETTTETGEGSITPVQTSETDGTKTTKQATETAATTNGEGASQASSSSSS